MDAKLSSSSNMSAACLDTSEPDIPIATPSMTNIGGGGKISNCALNIYQTTQG